MVNEHYLKEKILGDLAFRLHRFIVEECPVDTGRLRNSFVVEKTGDGYLVGTNLEYAEYVELGTGVYGPRKEKIKPVNAKALHWQEDGKDVFVKSVKGIKGKHFIQRAIMRWLNGRY